MSCTIKRILQFNQAVVFGPIRAFDAAGQEITQTCLYSWSSDGVCWTNWSNYPTYLNVCKNFETDFYLRVLLFGSFGKISINNIFTTCYSITLDQTNQFLIDFCGTENLFNPYIGLDCALNLQQQMADSVICMFGIPIYYFRSKPDYTTADYTFKEYVIRKVDDVKQLQLMISDGQMPSSKPNFTEWDFDWETDWETEIGKTQFAKAFGDTAFPKNGDFIYIPMMKRFWDVNSAYDEKNEGLMWRSTTWKLGLVKYTDSTNVDAEGFDKMIDSLVVNKYEDVFQELEKNEQERESGTTQAEAPKYAATNITNVFMEDSIRKDMTKQSISIIDKQFNHKSMVVAKYQYRFLQPDSFVSYQKGACGDSGTVSFILETPGVYPAGVAGEKHTLIRLGEVTIDIDKDLNVCFGKIKEQLNPFETYIVIAKWNHANFSTELSIYKHEKPTDVPVYKLRPEMYYFDFDNPIAETTSVYNNDYVMEKPLKIIASGWPCFMTNIKYFNKALTREDAIKESLKYTTSEPTCVFNDLARRLDSGLGYAVR